MAPAVRAVFAMNLRPGSSVKVSSACRPGSMARARVCGTRTKTRRLWVWARRKSSLVLPALMSWPRSVLRAVMVPAKGAVTRKSLELLQAPAVGARALGHGGLEREIGLFFRGFLLTDAGALQQLGPAQRGGPGQVEGGL